MYLCQVELKEHCSRYEWELLAVAKQETVTLAEKLAREEERRAESRREVLNLHRKAEEGRRLEVAGRCQGGQDREAEGG